MKFLTILFSFVVLSFANDISLFKVDKMHCPLCTTAVKKAILELNGVEKVSARLNTREVSVTYDSNTVKVEDILEAIKSTSYEGVLISTTKN